MTTTYYVSSQRTPPMLLRRTEEPDVGLLDEAYVNGAWKRTKIIIDYMFGHDDYVDKATDADARALEPGAF